VLTIPVERLRGVSLALFRAVGTPDDTAQEVTDIIVGSNLAGHDSHGVQLIPNYLGRSLDRHVPDARPEIVEESETTALVAGRWGWGQATAAFGTRIAIEKARRTKIAIVGMVECNHVGRLGEYSERAMREGMALIATLGSAGQPASTAPYGGRAGVLGTNPFSFGLPAGDRPGVLLDFATSLIANNKVSVALAKGEQLPPGAALDRDGNPTTDPAAAKSGVLLPFGGHKGYALAVCAELLGNVVSPSYRFPGPGRTGGTLFIAIDPTVFGRRPEYGAAADEVLARIKAVPPASGFSEVLLPGEPEARTRARRLADGVPLPEKTWEALVETGRRLGVDVAAA
jgi:uncharacterized oxidoreductase